MCPAGTRIAFIGANRYRDHIDEVERAKTDSESTVRSKVEHVLGDEAEVRIREVALSRTGEERQPTVCHLRPGKPVHGSQEAAVLAGVVVCKQHPPTRTDKSESPNDLRECVNQPDLPCGLTLVLMESGCQRFPSD